MSYQECSSYGRFQPEMREDDVVPTARYNVSDIKDSTWLTTAWEGGVLHLTPPCWTQENFSC